MKNKNKIKQRRNVLKDKYIYIKQYKKLSKNINKKPVFISQWPSDSFILILRNHRVLVTSSRTLSPWNVTITTWAIENCAKTYITIIKHSKKIPAVTKLYAEGMVSKVELYTNVYMGQATMPDKVSRATMKANTFPISSEGTVFEMSERVIGLMPPPRIFKQAPATTMVKNEVETYFVSCLRGTDDEHIDY